MQTELLARVEGRTQFKSHQEITSSHTLLATLHCRSKWFGVSSVLKLQRGHISLFIIPLLTSTDFEDMHPWVAIHTKSSTLGGHIFFQIANNSLSSHLPIWNMQI